MKNTFRTTVCCIACTLLAASAWAQREPGTGTSSSQQSPSSQGGLGSQSSQRSSSYSSAHGQQSFRMSQILNAQVKSQDGQQIGQIEDLIANPQTGKIEFAVVSKGEKLYPIPMQLLQCQGGSQGSSSTSTSGTTSGTSSTTSTDPSSSTSTTSPTLGRSSQSASGQKVTFVAQVDQQKLQQAPSFTRTQWPDISSTWTQQIYSHFGVQPEAAGGTSSSGSTYQGKSSSDSSKSKSGSSSSDTEKPSKDKSGN